MESAPGFPAPTSQLVLISFLQSPPKPFSHVSALQLPKALGCVRAGVGEHRATWSCRAFLLLGPRTEGRLGEWQGREKVPERRGSDRSDEEPSSPLPPRWRCRGFGLRVWRPQDWLAFPGRGGALNSLGVCRPSCGSLQTCVHCLEAFCSKVPLGQDPQLLGEGVNEAGGKQAALETPGAIGELTATSQASVPSPMPFLTHLFLFLQKSGLAVFLRQLWLKQTRAGWVWFRLTVCSQGSGLGASCSAFFSTWHILVAVKGSFPGSFCPLCPLLSSYY